MDLGGLALTACHLEIEKKTTEKLRVPRCLTGISFVCHALEVLWGSLVASYEVVKGRGGSAVVLTGGEGRAEC